MKVNGEVITPLFPVTLETFLLDRNYDLTTIAVERNGEIVPKATYSEVKLFDEDVLEIVQFVGGG